jgi:hypothetical protein
MCKTWEKLIVSTGRLVELVQASAGIARAAST